MLFQHKTRRYRKPWQELRTKKLCPEEGEKGKQNVSLNVGSIAVDREPPEEIKLVVVPIKQAHTSLNLTDASFETMGDKVPDSVDICKEKEYTGAEAANLLKGARNQTNQTHV